MAVDNLPCELPKMPAGDLENVLEHVFLLSSMVTKMKY
jgi:hypothetical protein